MPIIGRIRSIPYEYILENMYVGTKGYIYLEKIILTRFAVFIHLDTHVVSKFNKNIDKRYFLPIKRISNGLTELDFDLIWSDTDKIGLMLYPEYVYFDLIEENQDYLIFFIYEHNVLDKEKKLLIYNDKLKVLNTQLQILKAEENFLIAAKVRDEIETLKNKGLNSLFSPKKL
ncbi:MAG: hypothetical protein KGI58_01700 [Patescibacteria group bacterium]|nr:hypothetical protein [Patescibacteria group bacterium]